VGFTWGGGAVVAEGAGVAGVAVVAVVVVVGGEEDIATLHTSLLQLSN